MSCRKKVLDALGPCGVKHVMGTQLQIVEVCLEAIRWPPHSRSESPQRSVKILGLASQVHLKRRFLWKWILKWNVKWNLGEPGEHNPTSLGVSLNAPMLCSSFGAMEL